MHGPCGLFAHVAAPAAKTHDSKSSWCGSSSWLSLSLSFGISPHEVVRCAEEWNDTRRHSFREPRERHSSARQTLG